MTIVDHNTHIDQWQRDYLDGMTARKWCEYSRRLNATMHLTPGITLEASELTLTYLPSAPKSNITYHSNVLDHLVGNKMNVISIL